MIIRFAARVACVLAVAALAGCSVLQGISLPSFLGGGSEKPKPAELAPNPALLGVRACPGSSGLARRVAAAASPAE